MVMTSRSMKANQLTPYSIVGHFASACAEADRLCYNCKQPGHLSSECTEPKQVQPRQCFQCGEGTLGHLIAQCPVSHAQSVPQDNTTATLDAEVPVQNRGKRCFNCQQFGHIAKDCTNEPQPRSKPSFRPRNHRSIICNHCGGLNHFAKDCQASDILCYSCQKHGHIARDCPLTKSSFSSKKTCYVCGKVGHIARNCLSAKRERDESEEEDDVEDEEDDSDVTHDSDLGTTDSENESDTA
ncbi:hypothetical protein BD560DRAFT_75687 [Blakeslea trispora]|nr:hypothetical protein BD560DRAFT_75687 [Blakeslea trispora]